MALAVRRLSVSGEVARESAICEPPRMIVASFVLATAVATIAIERFGLPGLPRLRGRNWPAVRGVLERDYENREESP